MKNKEQLLYFFLQGKISLSQYDYKFMANLQSMIQNNMRVTSNQADLFDKLISKYAKQLTKQGLVKEELKSLSWKTMIVESTPEYTGGVVSLIEEDINIRVPFNKTFISEFRNVRHNMFDWSKETKSYSAPFSTNALKIAYTVLPKFFSTVRYDDELQAIITELQQYEGMIWNPTLMQVNGNLVVAAVNPVLAEIIGDMTLSLDSRTLFKLSCMGVNVDPAIIKTYPMLEFSASRVYEVEITEVEKVIGWMKNIGCENVLIGRAAKNIIDRDGLTKMIEKYGMKATGSMAFFGNKMSEGVTMIIQHTTPTDIRMFDLQNNISKTIVVKDSRPIEVK
jgi:hypothetical protein